MRKIFLFEYAACAGASSIEPSTAVEGIGMFKTLLHGFEQRHEVLTFIDRQVPYFKKYPLCSCNGSTSNFLDCAEKADFSLAVAPETENMLRRFTEKIEKSGCANLGSSLKAVKKTSDKYETYRRIRKFAPETELFKGSANMDFPLVAKPRSGVSGEGVFLVNSEADLEKVPRGYILQKYLEGRAMSASVLVGDEPRVLSINTQEIKNFRYQGAKLPVENFDAENVLRAVEKIKGLFGYVGVDFIYNGEVKVIEINARATTPIIALRDALGVNISDLILKNYYNENMPKVNVKSKMQLKKVSAKVLQSCRCRSFVTFKNNSIVLEKLNENIDL